MSFNDNHGGVERLHSALYGAPVEPDEIGRELRQRGFRYPVVVAVEGEGGHCVEEGVWVFRPGDGLVYLTASLRASRLRPDLDWQRAECAGEWLTALQRSIVLYRQRIRTRSGRRGWVGIEEEERMRQLALLQIRSGLSEWREAVDCWCDLIFALTEKKMHDTQRAFVWFATEAARPLGSLRAGAHRFHFALQQMLTHYDWGGLRDLLHRALEVVLEQQMIADGGRRDRRIQKARRFMGHGGDPSLSLQQVAAHVQMAPASLSRKFREVMGVSFTAYLQERRLEQAVQWLVETNRTNLDIALASGFGSVEQFHRVFKGAFGTTPSRFRRFQQKR